MNQSFDESYDIVVIGGGATGCGIALDASSRGYKVLLLEKNDIASGTSSKSSKLIHGGIRYLEKAVLKLDKSQYDLVKESLGERYIFLKNASHLSNRLKINTPIYNWFELMYVYTGLFFYKLLSFSKSIGDNSYVNKTLLTLIQPNIKQSNLVGAVSFYDGQFLDSRMALSLVQTAKLYEANIQNYHEVINFNYDSSNKMNSVNFKNSITNKNYTVKSKCIINASGPSVDKIRILDDKKVDEVLSLTSGIHIVVDKKYLPFDEAILIPKTKDGRIIFILPYLGKCLIGTTDNKTNYVEELHASQSSKEYLLSHVNEYFDMKLTLDDIDSSWCGIRPLLKPKKNKDSQNIVREHQILESASGLVSIVGGKWTTYRKMSEELVNYCILNKKLEDKGPSKTKKLKLYGSKIDVKITRKLLDSYNISSNTKKSLIELYGDKAIDVLDVARKFNSFDLICNDLPYLKAEVIYSIKYEFVKKPIDFLARRIGLCFLDKEKSLSCVKVVCEVMSIILIWDKERIKKEIYETQSLISKLF